MIKNVLIVVICCFLSLSDGYAQDNNFKKTFEKEVTKKDPRSNAMFKLAKIPWAPVELPSWFFNPPKDGVYGVGISDPDMERKEAYEMAELRAKAMAGLFTNVRVRYIKDNYASMREDQRSELYTEKFDTYGRIDTRLKGSFEIVDTLFTDYNEAVVLVKFNESKLLPKETINIEGKILFIEFTYGIKSEFQNKYELTVEAFSGRKKLNDFYYNLYEVGSKYNYISKLNGKEFDAPGFYYKYTFPGSDKPTYCNNGIWKEYVKRVLREMQYLAESSSFHMQESGDSHTSGKEEKLFRQTANRNYSFGLQNIVFKNDTIEVNINGMILDK